MNLNKINEETRLLIEKFGLYPFVHVWHDRKVKTVQLTVSNDWYHELEELTADGGQLMAVQLISCRIQNPDHLYIYRYTESEVSETYYVEIAMLHGFLRLSGFGDTLENAFGDLGDDQGGEDAEQIAQYLDPLFEAVMQVFSRKEDNDHA